MLLLLIIILLIIYYLFIKKEKDIEHFSWYKRPSCRYRNSKTLDDIMKKYNINKGDISNWELYIPCNYNNIGLETRSIPPALKGKKLFLLAKPGFRHEKTCETL